MAEAALPRVQQRGLAGPTRLTRALNFLKTMARRKPLGFVCLIIIVFMAVVAAFPGLFATHNPGDQDAGDRYQSYCIGPKDTFLCPTIREVDTLLDRTTVREGSVSVPLGADNLGRDNYSRIVYGTRIAMQVGFGAVIVSSMIALVIGVTSGYWGGKYDLILQRGVDAVMALPALVILLALPNLIGGPTVTKLVLILGVLGGVGGSRVIRSAVIGVRSAQYIEAARSIGAKPERIMVLHVVPNIFGPLMVQATIGLGGTILAEAALGFLGLGLSDNDTPTWGYMLNLARSVSVQEPWQAVWPGLAIAIAVFSFNMLGDALRDLLDPRLRGARGSFG
jgi:peptide/nickel transport system permease protein